jgi:hypothetical protein
VPTVIPDYRPGRAAFKHRGETIEADRPSYEVTAVYPEEADDFFGTRGQAERADWARYLYERGILLKTHPRLYLSKMRQGGPRRAYLLLRPEHQIPRKRQPRSRRVYTW